MHHDYWMERLIRLRRTHTEERQAHSRLEIERRRELTRQYQRAKPFFINPFERAMLIQRQVDWVAELGVDKQGRRELLRKRQSEEVYSLLRLKLGATPGLVALATCNDQ